LADLTFGMARGAEIRPVALLKTKRRTWRLLDQAGSLLAEVAHDRVTARRLDGSTTEDKWREMEVELAAADAAPALDRALRKAGLRRAKHSSKLARILPPIPAPPAGSTAGDAVLTYVRAQYNEIVHQDLRIRRDEPDAVHRMRVATRRLRSALRVYRRLLPGTERLREDLRWLGRQLAPARDLQVQQAHFEAAVAELPDDLVVGPVSARLTRYFSPAKASARRAVLNTLGDKRYRGLLDSIDQLLADPQLTSRASRPAASELPRHLKRAYRRTKRRLSPETLHRGRKAAKQYRYGMEAASPSVGPARKAQKRTRTLTKVLGEHQDGLAAQPVLRELGMQAHLAGENGFTFGLLHEQERTRQKTAEREYPRSWKQVSKTRLK
jgi:CHAD domain-containing protein